MTPTAVILSAPWVVPVDTTPIPNGAVVCDKSSLVAVGTSKEISAQYPDLARQHYPNRILTPALINAHIHLELSYATPLSQGEKPSSFTGWIDQLLEYRDCHSPKPDQIRQAAINTLQQQYKSGVSVLADIGNTGLGTSLQHEFPGLLFAFKEYLGFSSSTLSYHLDQLNRESNDTLCSAHAVYSTHKTLLQSVKQRAQGKNTVFPIHCAEPFAEIEFIQQGKGEIFTFLEKRGFWEESFKEEVLELQCEGVVDYLDLLGLLDDKTLCVHSVHVSDSEIQQLAKQKAKVCLCIGSNRFLQVGTPPVNRFLNAGILPALGTDSIASNPVLSLWNEMKLLSIECPEVPSDAIFFMATKGGAEALCVDDVYGTLAPGKKADILAIAYDSILEKSSDVYDHLVQAGPEIFPERIHFKS